jgi:hypothetical protein
VTRKDGNMESLNPHSIIQEWIIKKEGYTSIPIRKRYDGGYEWKLFSKYEKINVPLDIIERDILEYGEITYKYEP